MLIHNGGSLFHDFQRATEELEGHSIPLDELIEDYSSLKDTSKIVKDFVLYQKAPEGSLTKICIDKEIPVLLFTGLMCDFWQMFFTIDNISQFAIRCARDFQILRHRFKSPFHFICMGSAVIHPEVFTKAIAGTKNKEFTADVVDFLRMYRPKTRVAKYGKYYKMTHKKFLKKWLRGKLF